MTLCALSDGDAAKVVKLCGAKSFIEHMNSLGLHPGSKIRLIKCGPLHGPLLLEELRSGARFLLARQLANQIEVNHEGN